MLAFMFHFFHQYREVTPLNTDSLQCSGRKIHFWFDLQYETIWVGRQYLWFKSPWKWVCCRRPKQAGRPTAGRLNSGLLSLSDRLLHLKRFSQISLVQCFINREDCKVRITWENKKNGRSNFCSVPQEPQGHKDYFVSNVCTMCDVSIKRKKPYNAEYLR